MKSRNSLLSPRNNPLSSFIVLSFVYFVICYICLWTAFSFNCTFSRSLLRGSRGSHENILPIVLMLIEVLPFCSKIHFVFLWPIDKQSAGKKKKKNKDDDGISLTIALTKFPWATAVIFLAQFLKCEYLSHWNHRIQRKINAFIHSKIFVEFPLQITNNTAVGTLMWKCIFLLSNFLCSRGHKM